MMLLTWFVLLLFLFTNADNIVWREPGDSVTLECSCTECPSSIDGFIGMYLYHDSTQKEEVLYYYSGSGHEKITPRWRYLNRVEKKGRLTNHTITISDLNMADSGVYTCVYKKNFKIQVICNAYTLFVSGVAPQCPTSPNVTGVDIVYQRDVLVIIFSTCAISIFATLASILLILKVKQWTQRRGAHNLPTENVYEMMSKHSLGAPE